MQRQIYVVRMVLVMLALLGGYAALIRHVYCVQILRHAELYEKARRRYTTQRIETGQRGGIYDVFGNCLAGNEACKDVLAEPRRFRDDRREIVETLARELRLDPRQVTQRLALADRAENPLVEVLVKRAASIREAETVAGFGFRGIRFIDTYRRAYPKGTLLANVLGFIDAEGRGVAGVEQLLDRALQPTEGVTRYERDRRGSPLETENRVSVAPTNGADVYLTIREPVQQIVEEELMAMVDAFKPRAAYAVMANPATGAIMAMAQYPTFDPNDRNHMAPENWRNRILSDGFEPGSVMKSIAVAGALDFGVVTLDDVFDCEGGMWVYARRPLRDAGHSYDDLTVREIIQKSSNIGVAKIALRMGENRLFQTFKRFGFGEPTGIGFAHEAPGIFRPVRQWDGLSITRFPIGQGILATPLQLVQAFGALANDGLMMQLQIVDRIVDPETGVVEAFPPKIVRRAVRPQAARQITEAMILVTRKDGTATRAAVEGHDVAGKTGTAQKVVDGQYSRQHFVASFIGYVPANAPEFVLLVAADEPSEKSYYGGSVAAPTFSRIAEKTLRYLQVAPAIPGTPEVALSASAGNTP